MRRLASLLIALFASPALAAPDGKVAGLPASTFAVIKQVRATHTGSMTKQDAEQVATAILQDKKIDAAERDFLEEVTAAQFRQIAVSGPSLADTVTLYPVSGIAKETFRQTLNPTVNLEAEWRNGAHGWHRIVAEYGKGVAQETKVISFVADMLEPSFKTSTNDTAYRDFRNALAKPYAYSGQPNADSVLGKAVLCRASELLDKRHGGALPDFLYTWLRPKEVAWGCALIKEPNR